MTVDSAELPLGIRIESLSTSAPKAGTLLGLQSLLSTDDVPNAVGVIFRS